MLFLMTKPSPWRGNPLPNSYTLITSGDYADTVGAIIPAGVLDLDRLGSQSVSLTMYGGGFANGLKIYTEGVGGPVTMNFLGTSLPAGNFNSYAPIEDRFGTLIMNVSGQEYYHSYSSIVVDAGIQSNNYTAINLLHSFSPFNSGPTIFNNYGAIETMGTAGSLTSRLDINVNDKTTFINSDYVAAFGGNGTINAFVTAGGSFVNNGLIEASQGGMFASQGGTITGSGTLQADLGGRIALTSAVGAGETVNLNGGVLEFWSPPKLNFMGTITGMSSSSTILIDQVQVTSDSFRVISQAGAGLSELLLFDAHHQMVGDLKFQGHFQAADFILTDHARASAQGGDWTALTFVNHPNTINTYHS
jgi:hypothetical protein